MGHSYGSFLDVEQGAPNKESTPATSFVDVHAIVKFSSVRAMLHLWAIVA